MYVCKEEIFKETLILRLNQRFLKYMKRTRHPTRGEYAANGILLSLSI